MWFATIFGIGLAQPSKARLDSPFHFESVVCCIRSNIRLFDENMNFNHFYKIYDIYVNLSKISKKSKKNRKISKIFVFIVKKNKKACFLFLSFFAQNSTFSG